MFFFNYYASWNTKLIMQKNFKIFYCLQKFEIFLHHHNPRRAYMSSGGTAAKRLLKICAWPEKKHLTDLKTEIWPNNLISNSHIKYIKWPMKTHQFNWFLQKGVWVPNPTTSVHITRSLYRRLIIKTSYLDFCENCVFHIKCKITI